VIAAIAGVRLERTVNSLTVKAVTYCESLAERFKADDSMDKRPSLRWGLTTPQKVSLNPAQISNSIHSHAGEVVYVPELRLRSTFLSPEHFKYKF